FQYVLENPFLGWRSVISWPLVKMLPLLRPWLSLEAELGRYFRDPRIRLAFSFQAKYLGMSPFNCPSLFSILSFLEYEHGVFHPIGGCSAVMETMARLAESVGVEIRLNEEVKAVDTERGSFKRVRTDRANYEADAVVINADFAHAMRNLISDTSRKRWTDKRIDTKQLSCSTFMLYLGIKGTYEVPH